MRKLTSSRRRIGLGLSALALLAIAAPAIASAADHADAPGTLQSPLGRQDADINDVYAFPADSTHTVLAMTTHPGLGVVTTRTSYATDVAYNINVAAQSKRGLDRPVTFRVRFAAAIRDGSQSYVVTKTKGGDDDGDVVAVGRTGAVDNINRRDYRTFAGPRSDPFFFDLDAFNNTVKANGGRSFCAAGQGSDFFAALNTNAIVLQVPNKALGSDKVNVWASTTSTNGRVQYDRMARPAINTVFNGFKKVFNDGVDTDKNEFNAIKNPANDPTVAGGKFRRNVIKMLQEFSSLSGTPYTDAEAAGLADVLLPDVLPYDTSNPSTNGVFNGRSPSDDVIDTELNVVTKGAVPTDCVSQHTDYLEVFPYFGVPH